MNEVKDKTILLVEDEIFIAIMEIQQLEKIGYHLIHADGGLRAIEILQEVQGKIDLILMDIDLGEEKDGTQIAAEILKDYDIPILFLSSRTEVETVSKTETITSYGYVVKDSGITVLNASIKMAFKLFEANKKTEIQKEELNMLLYSIGDAVIATDKYGAIIRMNTIAENLTGFLFEEAKGKQLVDVFKIISAVTREVCQNPVELVLASGKIIGLANHTILISKTGEEYQIADSGSPIKDRDGNINGVVLVFRDVTKEYSIQRKIEESEKKFRTLFMQAAVGVAEIDTMTGCFIEVNKRYSEIVGVTEEELLALDFQSITHPHDLELDLKNMQLLKNGEINEFSMEKRYIRKNGSIVWVLLTVSQMWQIGESPTHHIAVVQDITERKNAEERILQLTHLYSTLSKINQSALEFKDIDSFYKSICRVSVEGSSFILAWIALVDYETGVVKGVASSENDSGYIDSLQINIYDSVTGIGPTSTAIKTGEIVVISDIAIDRQMLVWRNDATVRGYRSSVAIPFKLNEKVIGTFNLYSSVSNFFNAPDEMELLKKMGEIISYTCKTIAIEVENKRVKEELYKKENLYASLVNSMPLFLYRIDLSGRLTFLNQPLLESLNISLNDAVGKTAYDFYLADMAEKYRSDDKKVIDTGQTLKIVEENINPVTGNKIFAEVIKQPIFDLEGNVEGIQGIFHDITERKLADEKIFNLLKEKEHLLKEIHHRVKNNMYTIYSLLMVQADSEEDSNATKILQDAAGRVQSMMVLYDKLYRYQSDDTISIREYLPTLIKEIANLFPGKDIINIETEIDDIFLNSKVLSPLGILVNELITNTMKYAFVNRDSGIIRVTARKNGDRIFIEFEDNGNGIPESVSFESSKGFGLQLIGLLVKQIGGVISIDRANGTKFTIEFSH